MKALKFLGIALLACGLMFTSCKKDDKTANNSSSSETPGGGSGGGQTTPDGSTVTFNGVKWTAATVQGQYLPDYEVWDVYSFKVENAGAQDFPYADVCMGSGTNTGTFTATIDVNSGELDNEDFRYIEYYKDRRLTDQTYYYGDWWIKTGTVKVTAFDATSLKMTANVNATMFDAYEALVDQVGIDAAGTAPMIVDMKNIVLEDGSAAKGMKHYNNAKLTVAR